VNRRQIFFMGFGFVAGLSLSVPACLITNPDHCINAGGDSYCQAEHGASQRFCSDNTCA